jgi:hypothetical protein
MRLLPRFSHFAFCGLLAFGLLGCQTDRKRQAATSQATQKEVVFPGMRPVCPWYRTLEDLKRELIEPYESDAHLHLFEKDGIKVAVCVLPQGSIGWDAVIIYRFDGHQNFWGSSAFWDPYAMNVRVTFDKATGMIEARSGGGMLIFSANIAALKPRQNPFDW